MDHKIDSLKKRYFYKLFANIFGQGAGVAIQAMVTRGLGPKAYGDFNLLSNFFTQTVNFFDMGTSTAFYTKLSQRLKQADIVVFYRYYALIASFLVIAFVAASQFTSTYTFLWPGQGLLYIYLGAVLGILTWLVSILNKMTDAYGVTVSAEIWRVVQKFFGLALIVSLYILHQINLKTYFYYQYIILLMLGLAFIFVIKNRHGALLYGWTLPLARARAHTKEFYDYSHPLFTAVSFGFIVSIFDRWILQICGGSIQQGFFGLSYQVGLFCFLFTGAMTPLFMREFSIAFGNKDMEHMRSLFHKHIPLLYSITAFFACFMATQAARVIAIVGGHNYSDALVAVTIMAFYPIHQTYGQLSGSLIFATGQTRLYRNVEILFSLFGLVLSYFLIAPRQYWGLGAGATGLAVKMVVVQFIYVNTLLFFNTRLLGFSFRRYLGHQVLSVGCLLTAGIFARFLADNVFMLGSNVISGFLSAGIIYVLIVIGLVHVSPRLFGIKAETVKVFKARIGNIKKWRMR